MTGETKKTIIVTLVSFWSGVGARHRYEGVLGSGRDFFQGDGVDKRIIRVASELFFRKGYSAVTTEEIAYQAGISKKTLFKRYPTKKKLFDAVMDCFVSELEEELEKVLVNTESGCLSRIKGFFLVVASRADRVSRAMMEDLARVVPDAWDRFNSFRRRVFRERMGILLHQAQEEPCS